MGSGRGRGHDGRRAWARLNRWQEAPSGSGDHDDGGSALEALADVGFMRHLLDQAELAAVKTARRHGKSWAEISTKLGVTRQSAWERWRDLDDSALASPSDVESVNERRRRSSVVVPNVVGLSWSAARERLKDKKLMAVAPDQDGPPLSALGWPDGIVTDQTPEAGAKVAEGSPVTLWVERGGGSGVREPRRPKPSPRSGREMISEPSDEAVS